MKENKLSTSSFLEDVGLFCMKIIMSLYSTFLFKILWDWFLENKLFEIGYWELYLGLMLFRCMLLGTSGVSASIRLNKEIGREPISDRLSLIFSKGLFNTLIFGLFYIVKLVFIS